MSKRDQLGRGASFGSAASTRSARRNAIDQTINSGESGSTTTLNDLPVPAISDNPDNPRDHLRDLDATVESVREVGVILPIVVGTVDAYIRNRPERAPDLNAGAKYVVIDGHRRLEAARRVGLPTIPVRVDDARLSTDEKLLESAFIANYHRAGMTDLEAAHALKQLVDYYGGSQTKACKRLSMSASTLSSKLSLLKLTPELQKDLMTGERKAEHVRSLGRLSPEAQKEKADERAETARRRSQARHQSPVKPATAAAAFHGVKSNGEVTGPVDGGSPTASDKQVSQQESVPEPRSAPSGHDQNRLILPTLEPAALAELCIDQLTPDARKKLTTLLITYNSSEVTKGTAV